MQDRKQKILLTGLPGCGKTTVIIKMASLLEGRRLSGFYTQEIRSAGQRTGFSIRTFAGEEGILSSIYFKSGPRVGRYRVDIHRFEHIVQHELNRKPSDVDVFLIDEIGKMECFSQKFVEAITHILDSNVPVVATIAAKGKGIIAKVKTRTDVTIMEVTPKNREYLPHEIVKRI